MDDSVRLTTLQLRPEGERRVELGNLELANPRYVEHARSAERGRLPKPPQNGTPCVRRLGVYPCRRDAQQPRRLSLRDAGRRPSV